MLHAKLLLIAALAVMCCFSCSTQHFEKIKLTEANEQVNPLSHYLSAPTTVLLFLSSECPICQKYTLTLRQFTEAYPQVPIIGVFTRWDSPGQIRDFASTYQLPITLVQDRKHRLVKALKPSTTPEVFVLDAQRQVRYQGAIDNWFSGLGKYRPVVTEYYLKDALDALLKGDTVKVKHTHPIGCLIQQ